MLDGFRQAAALLKAPVYTEKTIAFLGPDLDSDDAVWEHIRSNFGSSWHMCCTTRMGNDIETACVDKDFRVFGLHDLRVVDLGVCPFVPR